MPGRRRLNGDSRRGAATPAAAGVTSSPGGGRDFFPRWRVRLLPPAAARLPPAAGAASPGGGRGFPRRRARLPQERAQPSRHGAATALPGVARPQHPRHRRCGFFPGRRARLPQSAGAASLGGGHGFPRNGPNLPGTAQPRPRPAWRGHNIPGTGGAWSSTAAGATSPARPRPSPASPDAATAIPGAGDGHLLLVAIQNNRERMTSWSHMSFIARLHLGSLF
jgi:hypothetical protein